MLAIFFSIRILELLSNVLKAYLLVCLFLTPVTPFFTYYLLRRNQKKSPTTPPCGAGPEKPSEEKSPADEEAKKGDAAPATPAEMPPTKPVEEPAEKPIEEPVEKPAVGAVEEEDIYARNEKNGIVNLHLCTGDSYLCVLSDLNRRNANGDLHWDSDNPFICNIDKRGNLKARYVGKSYINNGGTSIYYVDIEPRERTWYTKHIENIINRVHADDIRKMYSDTATITQTWKNILKIESAMNSVLYQFDNEDLTLRVLICVRSLNNIDRSVIGQYMSRTLHTSSTIYWHHMTSLSEEEEFKDSVDVFAFLKKLRDQKACLCVGRCWRPGASTTEFKSNLGMAEMTFRDLLDRSELPERLNTRTPKEKPGTESEEHGTHNAPDDEINDEIPEYGDEGEYNDGGPSPDETLDI